MEPRPSLVKKSIDLTRAFQVYRCWIVFTFSEWRSLAITTPILLWISATACGAMNITELLTHHEKTTIPRSIYNRPYLLAYMMLTLAQNITTTGQ